MNSHTLFNTQKKKSLRVISLITCLPRFSEKKKTLQGIVANIKWQQKKREIISRLRNLDRTRSFFMRAIFKHKNTALTKDKIWTGLPLCASAIGQEKKNQSNRKLCVVWRTSRKLTTSSKSSSRVLCVKPTIIHRNQGFCHLIRSGGEKKKETTRRNQLELITDADIFITNRWHFSVYFLFNIGFLFDLIITIHFSVICKAIRVDCANIEISLTACDSVLYTVYRVGIIIYTI